MDSSHYATIIAAFIALVGTWYTVTRKSSAELAAAQLQLEAAREELELSRDKEAREHWEALLGEYRAYQETLNGRVGRLETDVASMHTKLDTLGRKYRVSLAFVSLLLTLVIRYAPPQEVPTVPAEIAMDVTAPP